MDSKQEEQQPPQQAPATEAAAAKPAEPPKFTMPTCLFPGTKLEDKRQFVVGIDPGVVKSLGLAAYDLDRNEIVAIDCIDPCGGQPIPKDDAGNNKLVLAVLGSIFRDANAHWFYNFAQIAQYAVEIPVFGLSSQDLEAVYYVLLTRLQPRVAVFAPANVKRTFAEYLLHDDRDKNKCQQFVQRFLSKEVAAQWKTMPKYKKPHIADAILYAVFAGVALRLQKSKLEKEQQEQIKKADTVVHGPTPDSAQNAGPPQAHPAKPTDS